jgi:hypothetical protein
MTLWYLQNLNRIGGIMVSMLGSSGVDRVFQSRSDQTKDYKIHICCISAKYAALRRKRQRLVGLESEKCARVERHVYPLTVVLVR